MATNKVIQNLFQAYSSYLKQTKQPIKNLDAIYAIKHCRTKQMGSSIYSCPDKHEEITQHHSCRHRSCYLCAFKAKEQWIDKQKNRVLNVPHFHVIFTLPQEYRELWRYNESVFARLLFKASNECLQALLKDEKFGGFKPGILMALHTWGRQLILHPHTHCLVTAGGIDKDGKWKGVGDYLLPSAVIRAKYRGKVQSMLKELYESGDLVLPPSWTEKSFYQIRSALYKKEWNVRIEDKYAHGKGVVLYLARYCKGGPINPTQIKSVTAKKVEMSYLDHRTSRIKMQRLKPEDLINRLLQHVPVKGLHTIRYYGLYSSASKKSYEVVRNQFGNVEVGKGADRKDPFEMLNCCSKCGKYLELSSRRWLSKKEKGISLYKHHTQTLWGGSVQQVDEAVLQI